MDFLFNNSFIASMFVLFMALYASTLSRIKIPYYIKNLFDNTIFKIIFLSLLLIYKIDETPHVALAIALVFVLTIDFLSSNEIKENFAYLESFENQNKKNMPLL